MSTPISIHQRSYITEAFDEGDGTMRVYGRLTDTKPHGLAIADGKPLVIHDMALNMFVQQGTFEIVSVEADMHVHPYGQCRHILDNYKQLAGVSIARGYSRQVKEMFGGVGGCQHMGALLIALGPVAIQASWSLRRLHADPSDFLNDDASAADRERHMAMNLNTCHVWAEDGENFAIIRRGDARPMPGWERERLKELGVDL
ncbi:MAG: hypothetical protein ACI8Y4_003627 [Candidatus Poriferisodalaceae bacterium]